MHLLLAIEPTLSGAEYVSCSTGATSLPSYLQTQDQRKTLLASLRGQQIRVPDLKPLFEHWPTKKNESIDDMRQNIQQWLDE